MSHLSHTDALKSLTGWWEAMGVSVDRAEIRAYQRAAEARARPAETHPPPPVEPGSPPAPRPAGRAGNASKSLEDWVVEAKALANAAQDLQALKRAIEGFEGSPLREAAQNTAVFDGVEGAPVMVIGEGPGAEEDRQGLPFVGKAGQLLDRMLAAIGLSRKENAFITNVNYWRPPANRNPEAGELAVCRPFVDRMIELGQPKLVIAAGGVSAKSLLDTRSGIMRLRGSEHVFETAGGHSVPLFPIFHPAYLLRRPEDKSLAWRDLLTIQAKLETLQGG